MTDVQILTAIVAVVLLASFIRASLGFGDGLVSMPLLALFIPLTAATPLVAICSLVLSSIIVFREWHKIEATAAWRLIVGGLFGIPVGVLMLTRVPEHLAKLALGGVIVLWCLRRLFGPAGVVRPVWRGLEFGVGFVAGLLGGAYNTSGPPIVMYSHRQGWTPEQFRATIQSYFLPASMFIITGHAVAGLWNRTLGLRFACAVPALLLGLWIGGLVHRRIPAAAFRRWVEIALLVIGAQLVVMNAWTWCHPTPT